MRNIETSPVAARVIQKCGGPKAVADYLGLTLSVVYRWTYPRPHGTGGSIPAVPRESLIAAARNGDFDLSAEDFVDLPCRHEKRICMCGDLE